MLFPGSLIHVVSSTSGVIYTLRLLVLLGPGGMAALLHVLTSLAVLTLVFLLCCLVILSLVLFLTIVAFCYVFRFRLSFLLFHGGPMPSFSYLPDA